MREEFWKSPIGLFARETITATVIFFIISLPAIALSVFIAVAEKYGLSGFMSFVLTSLDYAIVTVDSLLFLAYLIFNAWELMKEILR